MHFFLVSIRWLGDTTITCNFKPVRKSILGTVCMKITAANQTVSTFKDAFYWKKLLRHFQICNGLRPAPSRFRPEEDELQHNL